MGNQTKPMNLSAQLKLGLIAILIWTVQGCSTVIIHSTVDSKPTPYAGTKRAMRETNKAWSDYYFYGQVMFVAPDVPFSFIADTLLFPFDYLNQAERAGSTISPRRHTD